MEALQVNINQDYLNNLVNQFFKRITQRCNLGHQRISDRKVFYFPIKKNN